MNSSNEDAEEGEVVDEDEEDEEYWDEEDEDEDEDEDDEEEEEEGENENEEMGEEELINPSTPSESRMSETGDLSDVATLSSKFRGVMLDRTGRYWTAQIYAFNDWISLGEFGSEIEAARAQDSASLKLLGTSFCRNFLLTNVTIYEPQFQIMFANNAILDMLRYGVYETEFIEFVRNLLSIPDDYDSIRLPDAMDAPDNMCIREMFHKVLTSSDVDNQSILTLPRESAMQHFPYLKSDSIDIPLEFTNLIRRKWVFHYTYSNSAQSYVFTTGWNKFVTEMNLRADDSVVFYRCTEIENSITKHYYLIDMNFSVKRDHEGMVEDPMEIGVDINRPSGSGEKEGNSKELMDVNGSEEKKT